MNLIYNKVFLEHDTGSHPECDERLKFLDLDETKVENGEKYLSLVYSNDYIDTINKSSKNNMALDPDTITSFKSYEVACFAVGATVQASLGNDFALVRPPGHHATSNRPMGFCLFNNVAIAVKNLVNNGKKVFILDFDCHYGNGTSDIFYDSNDVLYLSFHQYPFYPGNGSIVEIGNGRGKGYNICVPLPSGTGDDLYLETLKKFVDMIKDQFNPDIVGVSAGFDAHHSDPLGGLNYSLNAFYQTGKVLRKNFKNIFATLEGGYDPVWLAKCIKSFSNGINGMNLGYTDESTVSEEIVKRSFYSNLDKLKINLKNNWKFY